MCNSTGCTAVLTYFRDGFSPNCLSAFWSWGNYIPGLFYFSLDKLWFVPFTSTCPESSFHKLSQLEVTHYKEKKYQHLHGIIINQISNSITVHALWAIYLCTLLQFQAALILQQKNIKLANIFSCVLLGRIVSVFNLQTWECFPVFLPYTDVFDITSILLIFHTTFYL